MSKRNKKRKNIERICKNCRLYNPDRGECSIVVLHEGQRLRLPVLENDPCFFEEEYFDPTTKAVEHFAEDIKQVRFWVENEKGDKTDGNGTVKMEYPDGFLGTGTEEMLQGLMEDPDIFEYLKVLRQKKLDLEA
jgi:hypothetical protein